jgi:hypothetical protein
MIKTIADAIRHCEVVKYNYPDVFRDDAGLDIKIPARKLHAVPNGDSGEKRRVTLKISTFKGVSWDAIHYYGDVEVEGVMMEYDDEPDCSTMWTDDNLPLSHYSYRFRLQRELTQEEIDGDGDRWKYYAAGDMTTRFNTIEELISTAKGVFRLRFAGEWEFFVKSDDGKYDGKLNLYENV